MSEHTPVASIEPYADIQMTFRLSDELRNLMEFRGVSLDDKQALSYVRRRVTDVKTLVDLEKIQERYKQLVLSVGARAIVSQIGIQVTPGNPDKQRIYFASDHGTPLLTSLIDQFDQIPSQKILQRRDKSLLVEPFCYMDIPSPDRGLAEKILGAQGMEGVAAVIGRCAVNDSDALALQPTGVIAEFNRSVSVESTNTVVQFPDKIA